PPPAGGRGAPLRARLAGRLARHLGRHGRLGSERAPDVVVVDELVPARAGASLVKLLLDLGLCDPLLAGDVGNAAFWHQFPNSAKPRSSAQPGSAPPAPWPPPPSLATAASGHLVEATGAGRPAPDTRRPRGP